MKAPASVFVIALFLHSLALADTHVHGYTKKNGTYVRQHHRTSPDHTRSNNYSSKGKVNPYTGKRGTKTAKH
jgi:hypothetical protein